MLVPARSFYGHFHPSEIHRCDESPQQLFLPGSISPTSNHLELGHFLEWLPSPYVLMDNHIYSTLMAAPLGVQ